MKQTEVSMLNHQSLLDLIADATQGAMDRATDDTFAKRLLEYTQERDRNKVLTNFSNVDPSRVKSAFIDRMIRPGSTSPRGLNLDDQ